MRSGFQRGSRDRTAVAVVGALQVRRHRAHDPHQEAFGGLRYLGRLGDTCLTASPDRARGRLAICSLPLGK